MYGDGIGPIVSIRRQRIWSRFVEQPSDACPCSAVTDVSMEILIVPVKRATEVGALPLVSHFLRSLRVQSRYRTPQVANKHDLSGVAAPQRTVWPEALLVPGVNAVPAELVVQVVGNGLVDQSTLTVLTSVDATGRYYGASVTTRGALGRDRSPPSQPPDRSR